MPSTVSQLIDAADLSWRGVVPWGTRPDLSQSGVYVVTLTENTETVEGLLSTCPIDPAMLQSLVDVRPEVRLDANACNARELGDRICQFWLPDETVLYIGQTTKSVRKRVGDYYRTPIGAKRPHAGGWFLKALANLDQLFVHFAAADEPHQAEDSMLDRFCSGVSERTRSMLPESGCPFPFANLAWPRGTSKPHGITGARGDLPGF